MMEFNTIEEPSRCFILSIRLEDDVLYYISDRNFNRENYSIRK